MLIGLLTILPLLIIYKKFQLSRRKKLCYTQVATFDFKRFKNSNCPGDYFILCRWLRYPIYLYYAFLASHIPLSMTEISGILFLAGICSFLGSRVGNWLMQRVRVLPFVLDCCYKQ